jgi:hypothetical protein
LEDVLHLVRQALAANFIMTAIADQTPENDPGDL